MDGMDGSMDGSKLNNRSHLPCGGRVDGSNRGEGYAPQIVLVFVIDLRPVAQTGAPRLSDSNPTQPNQAVSRLIKADDLKPPGLRAILAILYPLFSIPAAKAVLATKPSFHTKSHPTAVIRDQPCLSAP